MMKFSFFSRRNSVAETLLCFCEFDYWKEIISELRLVGYDYAISIEHEDSLMSGNEGLTKAIRFLKDALIFEDKGEMYWA